MSLSEDQIQALNIGSIYRIEHQRKGTFIGQLIDIEPLPEGDAEAIVLVMKYDVRQGTAQAGLAIDAKQRVRVSGLRPSLIVSLEPSEENDWLREVRVPQEDRSEAKERPGLREQFRKLFG
mgnify:CR=1 FL=1